MATDPNNAHIRKQGKRQSPEVKADEARQLLDNPAFQRAFDGLESSIVKLIVETPSDGSPEHEAAEREMCRSLRNLHALKSKLTLTVQNQQLRVADFKPTGSEG